MNDDIIRSLEKKIEILAKTVESLNQRVHQQAAAEVQLNSRINALSASGDRIRDDLQADYRSRIRRTISGVADLENSLGNGIKARAADIESDVLRFFSLVADRPVFADAEQTDISFFQIRDGKKMAENTVIFDEPVSVVTATVEESLNGNFCSHLVLKIKRNAVSEDNIRKLKDSAITVVMSRGYSLCKYVVADGPRELLQVLPNLPGKPAGLLPKDIFDASFRNFTGDVQIPSGGNIYYPQARGKRHWNGVVSAVSLVDQTGAYCNLLLEVRSKFWVMALGRSSRVFSAKSVREILRDIFVGKVGVNRKKADADIIPRFTVALDSQGADANDVILPIQVKGDTGSGETLQTRIQYEESDWDFACRLMQQEGYEWRIEHGELGHRLVVMEEFSSSYSSESSDVYLLAHSVEKRNFAVDDQVISWTSSAVSQPSAAKLRDRAYTRHTVSPDDQVRVATAEQTLASLSVLANSVGDSFSSFGGSAEQALREKSALSDAAVPGSLSQRAIRMAESFLAREHTASVVSYSRSLLPGRVLEWGSVRWRVVRVVHRFHRQRGVVAEADLYHLPAVPLLLRPLPDVAMPRLDGVHNAIVVNEEGMVATRTSKDGVQKVSYLDTDSGRKDTQIGLGRVRLLFLWDENREPTSFVRVNQVWAGNNFGFFFIPRVGMEVLVAFEQGDIDRPVVVGSVYSQDAPPKYGNATKYSGISSWPADAKAYTSEMDDYINSSIGYNPGGQIGDKDKLGAESKSSARKELTKKSGFNEIRFSDVDGKQELYLGAPKQLTQFVMGKQLDLVSGERATWIWGNYGPRGLKEIWEYSKAEGFSDTLDAAMGSDPKADIVPLKVAKILAISGYFGSSPKDSHMVNGSTSRTYNGGIKDVVQGNVSWNVHGAKFSIKQTGYAWLVPMNSVQLWVNYFLGVILKHVMKKITGPAKDALEKKIGEIAGAIASSFLKNVLSFFFGYYQTASVSLSGGWEAAITQFLLEVPLVPASPVLNGFLALIYTLFDSLSKRGGIFGNFNADKMVSMEITTAGSLEISAARELVIKAPVIRLETPNIADVIASGDLQYVPKLLETLAGDKVGVEINASGMPKPKAAARAALKATNMPRPAIYSVEMIGLDVGIEGFQEIDLSGGLVGVNLDASISEISLRGARQSVNFVEAEERFGDRITDVINSNIKAVEHQASYVRFASRSNEVVEKIVSHHRDVLEEEMVIVERVVNVQIDEEHVLHADVEQQLREEDVVARNAEFQFDEENAGALIRSAAMINFGA